MQQSNLDSRIAGYLEDISARLTNRSEEERTEILRNIEDHIQEALRQRGGREPSMSDLDHVLKSMDAPDSYGPPILIDKGTAIADAAGNAPVVPSSNWHFYLWPVPAVVCLWILWFIALFIAPKFTAMYREMDLGQLPLMTETIFWFSYYASSTTDTFLLALITGLFLGYRVYHHVKDPRKYLLGIVALVGLSLILPGFGVLVTAMFLLLSVSSIWVKNDPRRLSIMNATIATASLIAITVTLAGLVTPMISIFDRIGK
jgi:hypothetical protein